MAEEPGTVSKIANVFRGEEKAEPAKRTKAVKAKTPGRKKDLSQGFSMVWGISGGALAMQGRLAGRVMQVQAPMAGRELNRWVKEHDLIYGVLAPVLGNEEVTVLTRVFGPPVMVELLQRSPQLLPVFRPILVPMLWDLFKEIKKMGAKEQEIMEALAESEDEDARAEFEEFMAQLGLAGGELPPQEPEPAPEPEPDVPQAVPEDDGHHFPDEDRAWARGAVPKNAPGE